MGKSRLLSGRNLRDVPEQSGVYHLMNRKGDIIYTGSAGAGRLKERLRNREVRGATRFQTRPLSSIAEAREVERALIERHKPRANKRAK